MTTPASALLRAIQYGQPSVVRRLLEAGVDANIRVGDACNLRLDIKDLEEELNSLRSIYLSDEETEFSLSFWEVLFGGDDPGVYLLEEEFYDDEARQHWYPIQHAAYLPDGTEEHRHVRDVIMNLLLDNGVNLLATYHGRSGDGDHILDYIGTRENACRTTLFQERTVLHSLLQDGSYVLPVLQHASFTNIDLESRDAQGRTVLHAVCRSRLGADAGIHYTARDEYLRRDSHAMLPLRCDVSTLPSLLMYFLFDRQTNLMATDHDGGNALHNLFRSFDVVLPGHMPAIMIDTSLLLARRPELVNEADRMGMYPMHYALKRFMYYDDNTADYWAEEVVEAYALSLWGLLWNLHLLDGDGNSALHYLAGWGRIWRSSIHKSYAYLLQTLLDAGLDLNLRNKLSHTPLEMFLGIHCQSRFSLVNDPDDESAGWKKLIDCGADWMVADDGGNTLIHLLAEKVKNKNAASFIRRLIVCGVERDAINHKGCTALELARSAENTDVISVLEADACKVQKSQETHLREDPATSDGYDALSIMQELSQYY